MYVFICEYMCNSAGAWGGPDEGLRCPGGRVIDCWEPLHVGAGNRTRILCKSSVYSEYLSPFSGPSIAFFNPHFRF